jgi:hypothetical protein
VIFFKSNDSNLSFFIYYIKITMQNVPQLFQAKLVDPNKLPILDDQRLHAEFIDGGVLQIKTKDVMNISEDRLLNSFAKAVKKICK